ncbi:TetR/AcrR family transcriptional regulator [Amycolatopsis acidicola]|uniref:TetR/AcrR family transcriptional regulator n=1 Tax=Amycolatopsis acidicola TaxID=2596893 RepID=UPI0014088097|nr:TetR/AcrR family transcriptional regulator [Amycolatopsis acidicola]
MASRSRATGRSGGGSRIEDEALVRQRLVAAATEEFEEHGYAQSSVERIARRAGAGKAEFYTHFAGKDELAEGLWDVARVRLIGLYRELTRTRPRDLAALERWLRKTFLFYRRNRHRLLAVHEAIALEPRLAEVYFEHTREVTGILAPLSRPRPGDTGESPHTRIALLSMQHERFCFLAFLRGMAFDEDEAVRALARTWFEELGEH